MKFSLKTNIILQYSFRLYCR